MTITWQRCKGGKIMYDNIDLLVARAIFEYLQAAYPDGWKEVDPVWLSCSNHGKREPIGYRAIAGVCKKYFGVSTVHSTRHTAARKLQDPEARQQLRDLARQWRHMADGCNSVFGQADPIQTRDESSSKVAARKRQGS